MDDLDDTDDFGLLLAAATVHAARRRLCRALGPLVEGRHAIPEHSGADHACVEEILGAAASSEAQAAWDHLATAMADRDPVNPTV